MSSYIAWALLATASFSTLTLASPCREYEWACRDGSCVPPQWLCDGMVDCRDRSDESHAVCHREYCHESRFRCQYGVCMDSTAFCNGIPDCPDSSDEVPRRCNNETLIHNDEFKCNTGQDISADLLCDGAKDCSDGSDETLDACAGWYCAPNHFQCAYGACVNADAKCSADEHWDCADGSDEDFFLCNRTQTAIPNTTPEDKLCIVPDHPEHGKYVVLDKYWNTIPGKPGDAFQSLSLRVECEERFMSDKFVVLEYGPHCSDGQWVSRPAQCKQFCTVPRHSTITYFCGDEECDWDLPVPIGTVVRPQCKEYYIYPDELKNMTCVADTWDYVPTTCIPDIKKTIENNTITLVIGKDLVIHLKGSQYIVSMDYDSKTILNESVPNGSIADTVVPNTPVTESRLNPAFHPRYDPVAYKERQEEKARQEN